MARVVFSKKSMVQKSFFTVWRLCCHERAPYGVCKSSFPQYYCRRITLSLNRSLCVSRWCCYPECLLHSCWQYFRHRYERVSSCLTVSLFCVFFFVDYPTPLRVITGVIFSVCFVAVLVMCKVKRAKWTPKAKSAPISLGRVWNTLGRFGQKESKQFKMEPNGPI